MDHDVRRAARKDGAQSRRLLAREKRVFQKIEIVAGEQLGGVYGTDPQGISALKEEVGHQTGLHQGMAIVEQQGGSLVAYRALRDKSDNEMFLPDVYQPGSAAIKVESPTVFGMLNGLDLERPDRRRTIRMAPDIPPVGEKLGTAVMWEDRDKSDGIFACPPTLAGYLVGREEGYASYDELHEDVARHSRDVTVIVTTDGNRYFAQEACNKTKEHGWPELKPVKIDSTAFDVSGDWRRSVVCLITEGQRYELRG